MAEPIRRRFSPDPQGLLELWRHEGPRTVRAVGLFDDADLAYRPPGGRSVGELAEHLAASCLLTLELLRGRAAPPPGRGTPPASVADGVEGLRSAHAALFAALAALPAAAFDAVIVPFGQPETCGVMAFGMLKHELHHRGELHALARVCGRAVPSLYAPVVPIPETARQDGGR